MSTEPASPMGLFERYLSLWIALCIAAGVGLGIALPGLFGLIAGRICQRQPGGCRFHLGDDLPDDGQC